jgi:3-hydroxyisobutyrate dehydrogenase
MKNCKIGWIGLGNMGIPMSINLVKAGFDVAVYNRTLSKTAVLKEAGASVFVSLPELVAHCDIIFTVLSDDKAVGEVYARVQEENIDGKLFINMSTISPALAQQLFYQLRQHTAGYLDAPVSGSVKPATDGTLLILGAGEKAHFERALPLFDVLGKMSLYLGEAGVGSKAKLAINYYMSVVVDGLADTLLFAQQQGISRETMLEIVNESACGSPMSKMKTPGIVSDNYPATFPLKYMLKDVKLIREEGLSSALSASVEVAYQSAFDDGYGEDDLVAVMKSSKR